MKTIKYLFPTIVSIINLAAIGLIFWSFVIPVDNTVNGRELTDLRFFYKHLRFALTISFICSTLVLLIAWVFKRQVKLRWPLLKFFVFNFVILLILFLSIYSYIQIRY